MINPVKASLRYPQVTVVLALAVMVAGIHAVLTMPRREDPKITVREGLVITHYPGATAEQVEQQVTRKIEEQLFRFSEVRKAKTYSTSRPDLSIVNVELETWVQNADEVWSKMRLDLNELKQTTLPTGVDGPTVNTDFGDVVAVLLAVQGQRYGPRELQDYLDRIDDAVRAVPAASKIKHVGEQREQIYVTSSLSLLAQYHLTPRQLIGALQQQNLTQSAGTFDAGPRKVPLRMAGLFQTEDEIRRLMVDASPATGQPVFIGDLAQVERRYQDPEYQVRFKGQPALLLSVEMQEGNNIVDFGKGLDETLARLRPLLPPDLRVTKVIDQPTVVQERISHFFKEFGIALLAVVAVTMVLLPFRVALIAALAIPVTLAATFTALDAFGIELHQVSIAALIVVLGMVVDDAIVIADNYVELLDEGVPRADAAWRSATEMAVPVFTATLTIIAAFLPLAFMLVGTTGEFIRALPITVAVALACSFVVAMLLTPLLCRAFIRQGLHPQEQHPAAEAHDAPAEPGPGESQPNPPAPKRPRFNPLDVMQAAYDRVIGFAMKRRRGTLVLGFLTFVLGLVLMRKVPQQFFPSAERDQFVINVWLPEGSRFEATDAVVQRLEARLANYPGVHDVLSFIGGGPPRFYYNLSPEPRTPNYAQLVVRSSSEKATPELVARLTEELPSLAPGTQFIVKELQQGSSVQAPNEVRIIGPDLPALRQVGAEVVDVFQRTPSASNTRTNFRNDIWQVNVDLNRDASQRVGLSTVSMARQLAASFQGEPVSTYWEGNRAVDIMLRVEESRRRSFDNVRSAYVTSEVTGAHIPLAEVANLAPDWRAGRIVRRNGVRTLSVFSEPAPGTLASTALNAAQPAIGRLALPAGYQVKYGGDDENQRETFGYMVKALGVSIVAIFLIVLFQFRRNRDVLVVMATIPLALGGGALGLLITGNPFGFTAFIGMISLAGLVVRNGIILVDYIFTRQAHGVPVEEAALEAGRRRLRPIFLTTCAAAIGVLPMILSGSSLWSPLASVIAVGLLCSMVFTLVIVPVLYVVVERGHKASEQAA